MNRKTRLRIRDNKQLRRWKQRTRYECSTEFIAANLLRNAATQLRSSIEVGLNTASSYSREDDDFTDDGCRRKYEYTDDGPRY